MRQLFHKVFYILIPVSITLTLIQRHSVARKLEFEQSFCCKMARNSPNFFLGWLCEPEGDDCNAVMQIWWIWFTFLVKAWQSWRRNESLSTCWWFGGFFGSWWTLKWCFTLHLQSYWLSCSFSFSHWSSLQSLVAYMIFWTCGQLYMRSLYWVLMLE